MVITTCNTKVIEGVVPAPNVEVGEKVIFSLFEGAKESKLNEGMVIMKKMVI